MIKLYDKHLLKDRYEEVKMEKKQYLDNPTGSSALSYWKTCNFKNPANIKVIHENKFNKSLLETHNYEVYFKLVHYLDNIDEQVIPHNFKYVKANTEEFVNHINSCYGKEGLTISELESCKNRPVYDENLWICLYDKNNDVIAATGIAEFDKDIKEGSLDWIQVSEGYRSQGLGKTIVYELLRRLKKKADFVTVSGRKDNKFKPEKLYKSCGFENKVMWYVLIEKN